MKKTLLSAALAVLSLGLLRPAMADTVNLFGDTTGAPTFNRTTETGDLSVVGSATNFQVIQFTISLGGSYTLNLTANDPATFDTFAILYVNAFNPGAPQANFLQANDDANLSTFNSSIVANLSSGTTYYLVATAAFNGDFGRYTATLSGPGTISASVIPEPHVLPSVFGLVFLGAIFTALRRRAQA